MSANSPVPPQAKLRNNVVLPQPVTDPSILDSVAGFINEVVPTAYQIPNDFKDQIQWARFENVENLDDDLKQNSKDFDSNHCSTAPLLLVLGYTTGIQIWAISVNGEASEILSWRHGSVRTLRILPTPTKVGKIVNDVYSEKRPLIALCDTVTPGTDYCSLSFISLKTGEQVKLIKFKNPILDVIPNRTSIAVTFNEKIAVFDAFNLEDRLTITTCYISPGLCPNPIALGARWLAYAENKLIPSKRSSGGNDGEGVQSYTATVLHAAKTLGRGLRELGESVATSLTGNATHKPGLSVIPQVSGQTDVQQKGIVTIVDIEDPDLTTAETNIVAHFAANKAAIVYLSFDPSGMLLLTADKRGHDFHLFRIYSHPGGPALAAVHHLYILHRGDTTAQVQDMCFSPDSRWVTVSSLRGTTHTFPINPYGGNVGLRTHAALHVVNKMSRFHRSAGLSSEARSHSPVSLFETPINSNIHFNNPRLPPFPHPIVITALSQIRQPFYLQNPNSLKRQNLGLHNISSSEDSITHSLRVSACFASPRAWIEHLKQPRETAVVRQQNKPIKSLFIISVHGSLIQYDLEPQHSSTIPKEKLYDDTLIELLVTPKAQWILQRQQGNKDVPLPVSAENISLIYKEKLSYNTSKSPDSDDEIWLSQVEMLTHEGPHRRLWMGPQITFKSYNGISGNNIMDAQPLELNRSMPMNMPLGGAYPVMIETGSVSSCEPSPKLLDCMQHHFEEGGAEGELRIREDIADAMLESPAGGRCVLVSLKQHNTGIAKVVNPLGMVVTVQSDDDSEVEVQEEIIHENCDEALFRPVVSSKVLVFAQPKSIEVKNNKTSGNLENKFQKDNNKIKTIRQNLLNKEVAKSNVIYNNCKDDLLKPLKNMKYSNDDKKVEIDSLETPFFAVVDQDDDFKDKTSNDFDSNLYAQKTKTSAKTLLKAGSDKPLKKSNKSVENDPISVSSELFFTESVSENTDVKIVGNNKEENSPAESTESDDSIKLIPSGLFTENTESNKNVQPNKGKKSKKKKKNFILFK